MRMRTAQKRWTGTLDGEPATFYRVEESRDVRTERLDGVERDPSWRGCDSNGHRHVPETAQSYGAERVRSYPSLEERYGEPFWCEDCQEEHRPWLGLFCRLCGEQVEPGMRPARDLVMPGPVLYRLSGYQHELPTLEWGRDLDLQLDAVDGKRLRAHVLSVRADPTTGGNVELEGYELAPPQDSVG